MAIEDAMNRFQNSAKSAYSRFDALCEDAEFVAPAVADRMGITGQVQVVASALVLILLIVYVLNEVFNAVDPETDPDTGEYIGPFGDVIDDLETTGAAALGLLVIAVLVVAAGAIMRMFGGSGFGTR